ncbi:MAG: DUF2085 domain-containing protein [Chloroflexi bacterium]|nr:DUF2085 domain-containing protein [Chloroflexota bacterium]
MTSSDMDSRPLSVSRSRIRAFPLPWLVIVLAIATLATYVVATPGGLLSEMDMVGYAVCHRIIERSFVIAGRQLPLCARCTGTFIGALVGFFGQAVVLRRRRAAEFPPPFIFVILIGFTLLWATDGLNSYMVLIRGPHVYEPRNWLRLTTGALQGLTMSAFVYPVFNFTLWHDSVRERTIRNLRELGVLVLLQVGLIGLVLTEWDILLYPLTLLSAGGVLTLLTCINSMIVLMLTRRENTIDTWRASIIPLLAGLTLSIIQIGVIDLLRYALTGTLEGFSL